MSEVMKPLFVPLKTEYFLAFQRGEKRTEYRPYGPRYNERTCFVGRKVILSHGYSGARIEGRIRRVRIMAARRVQVIRAVYPRLPDNAPVICIEISISIP